jgi:glycosyltransferase involved in cell wall biosynthesis
MIFLPKQHPTEVGGAISFMRNLTAYLKCCSFPFTHCLKQAGGLFFPIMFELDKVILFSRMGLPIIQRLDGVYYPEKHGDSYVQANSSIKRIYQNYATFVVFQSEYSKRQCFEMFGEKKSDEYTLITNGADKSIWKPAKKKSIGAKIKFVTTGNFRNIDMIGPVVEALDKLLEFHEFELHVVGPVSNPEIESFFSREYIVLHGALPKEQIVSELQQSDIFIYSHLNPPCPNSVIEAISCGLPIVGFDSGSMSELCHFNKELLAYVSEDTFQKYEQFDANKLVTKIQLCINEFDLYKSQAMKNAHLHSMAECGDKYQEVFEQEISKCRKVSSLRRHTEFIKLAIWNKLGRLRKRLTVH